MGYSEEQCRTMGLAYHRGERPVCPADGTLLEVHEVDMMADPPRGIDLHFSCPRCGETGHYESGRSPVPWTEQELAPIIDGIWRRNFARCPRDQAIIRFIKTDHMGAKNVAHVRCPVCAAMGQG